MPASAGPKPSASEKFRDFTGSLTGQFTGVFICGSGLSVGVVVGGGAVGHDQGGCSLLVEGDGGVVGVDPAVVVFAGG